MTSAERNARWRASHLENARERNRQWYYDNRARAAENSALWHARRPDYGRARYLANPKYWSDFQTAWRKAHPFEWHEQRLRARARKTGAAGVATARGIAARWAMWGNRCWMCGVAATCTDHVKPLSKGGSNWPANLRPACQPCNSHKHNAWPILVQL